jgi:hypothetical protein
METTSLTKINLTDYQQKIFTMLAYMKQVTSESEVKSTDEIMSKHGLPAMYGTILRSAKIISKNKVIKWNPEADLNESMAVNVERYYQLYPKLMQMKKTFKDFFKSTETHPFPFNEIWEQLEYYDYKEAKRSLLRLCEINADFIGGIEPPNSPQNGQNGRVSENIKLSKVGLFTFLNASQKPWAKFFARTMYELDQEAIMFLRKLSSGVIMIAEKANLLDSADVAMMQLKNEYRELEKEIHSINKNPQLLLIGIEEGAVRNKISSIWDDAKRIAMEIYDQKINIEPMPENKTLELPESNDDDYGQV